MKKLKQINTRESGVRMREQVKTFQDILVWRKEHLFVLGGLSSILSQEVDK